jgi:hypothetical protein
LLVDPLEERGLVDQDAASDASDYGVKAVGLRVEDEVADAALGGPRVLLGPLLDGEEAGTAG